MCILVLVFLLIVAQIQAGEDVSLCLSKHEILNECPGLAEKYLKFGGPDTSMLFDQIDGRYYASKGIIDADNIFNEHQDSLWHAPSPVLNLGLTLLSV